MHVQYSVLLYYHTTVSYISFFFCPFLKDRSFVIPCQCQVCQVSCRFLIIYLDGTGAWRRNQATGGVVDGYGRPPLFAQAIRHIPAHFDPVCRVRPRVCEQYRLGTVQCCTRSTTLLEYIGYVQLCILASYFDLCIRSVPSIIYPKILVYPS